MRRIISTLYGNAQWAKKSQNSSKIHNFNLIMDENAIYSKNKVLKIEKINFWAFSNVQKLLLGLLELH